MVLDKLGSMKKANIPDKRRSIFKAIINVELNIRHQDKLRFSKKEQSMKESSCVVVVVVVVVFVVFVVIVEGGGGELFCLFSFVSI